MSEKTGRSGGRAGRRRLREARSDSGEIAYRNLVNPFRPVDFLPEEDIEKIHDSSLEVLEEIGIKVLSARARKLYEEAGAIVDHDSGVVRIGRDIVEHALTHIAPEIHMRARNPERDVRFGGEHIVFVTTAGPPHVSDLDRGRRAGDIAAHKEFTRLSQSFDVIGVLGAAVEPVDRPLNLRHLEQTSACLLLSDKPTFAWSRGPGVLGDTLEMIRIAHDLDPETFINTPCCYSVANVNSPLQLDALMCHGIMYMAEMGQVMIVTPFTLAGAMAPVTLVGAVNQQNAEALAGITLSQLTRPGAPVVYGGFTSNVDMKSGSPAFGTPEYAQGAMITGQLTRKYNIPYRSSGSCASTNVDAQAAYETQMALWSTLMSGCHFYLHAAGWLEGGLAASYEKFIIDVEMLRMFAAMLSRPEVNDDTLALDAMRQAGFGGHYFGCDHTLSRYENAFYAPIVSDWNNYETWVEQGELTATQRANGLWKRALDDYREPPMDPAVRERLLEFVERRTREGGAVIENES